MSWLKGLAGKAEDFLNQIDQNAAVALHIDRKDSNAIDSLTEVTWDGQTTSKDTPAVPVKTYTPPPPPNMRINNESAGPSVRSSPSIMSLTPTRGQQSKQDDDLMKFLNSAEPIGIKKTFDQNVTIVLDSNGSDDKDCNVTVDAAKERNAPPSSSSSIQSHDNSSLGSRSVSPNSLVTEPGATWNGDSAEELRNENVLIKNELRSLNNEMSLLLQRTKAAEKEVGVLQQALASAQAGHGRKQQEMEEIVARLEMELQASKQQLSVSQESARSMQFENNRLVQASADLSGFQSQAKQDAQNQLAEKELEVKRLSAKHLQELANLRDRLASYETDRADQTRQLVEAEQQLTVSNTRASTAQQQLDKSRVEVKEARGELDQYRSRAQRILQDKEKLILELRGQGSNGRPSLADDSITLELEQLRQERELLREETVQVSCRLQAVRDELQEVETRLEASREQAAGVQKALQESVQEERRRRQTAEEDCRAQADELRSVRDELSRQRELLAARVRDREAELTRLRSQLSQRPASPQGSELESRLHTLTQTLVQKQSSLETVSTERNALRLQLEKMEHKNRDMCALLNQNQNQPGFVSVNDTDDAKARVPSFLVESPFDTGVTRRVKRAYSTLDAVGIRTGVFLRRYPLARVFVVCYMVLLHLWVMFVLFAYKPQTNI